MDYEAVLAQVLALLQQEQRLSYRVLKRRLHLEDDLLEDLKEDLIYAKQLAVDEDGRVLVWVGEAAPPLAPPPPAAQHAPQPATPEGAVPHTAPPPAVPSTPEAERRQLTVLFCDLVDSTPLSRQLDPEDLREVVRAYQDTCAKVIARFEGHIAQYLGDGLLVYFGYPRAHEDDAQRAVRAGLGIVEAMGPLNTRLTQERGVQLAVRLGIHTGLVVVGEVGGSTRQEQLALGETPNLAARLQGVAAPNTLVISAATFQLLGGFFACQPLGTPLLKGQAQPLAVYRVLYESMARSRLEAVGSTGLTPLVGREQEVGLLRERWAQVKEGLGQVVLLSGEAGIGKSRLVQMLKDQVATESQAWLTPCQCSPYHQHSALYPWIDLLERVALRFEREEPSAQKLRKLEGFLVQYGLSLAETVPLFATLLSLPLPTEYAPLTVSSEQQKQQTLHALLTILLRLAAQQPVLFVMEDLHWVDPSTLEFLSLLVDQGPTARILALLTFRPDFSPPWTGRSHLTQVTLHRLMRPQAAEIICQVAHGKTLPPEVIEQIVAKTDGVPLFVEELTKMVLESGLLQERDDRYALTGPLPPLAIPTTLHDSLMARLDRLAAVKGLAQLAATLGREFSYELLQAVSPWDEGTVQRGLHQLVAAEFLYQRGLPPQATYVFKHALIQDVAYQSLLRSTRQQHHQRIAQALEAQFPETVATQPELVAQHYTTAGCHAPAILYWLRAGQQASDRSAYREAVVCYEQALAALEHLPASRAATEQAIDLRLGLRTVLTALGEAPGRMLDHLRHAETLAQTLGDPLRLGWVYATMSTQCWVTSDVERAITYGQRTLALADTLGHIGLQARAHLSLGQVYSDIGDYPRASASLAWNVARLQGELRYARFSGNSIVAAASRTYLGYCHAERGTFTEGLALAEEGLRIAERVHHPFSMIEACRVVSVLYLRQGDVQRAIPVLERAMALCQEWHISLLWPSQAVTLGVAYALAGRGDAGLPLAEHGMEQEVTSGRARNLMLVIAHLSEAYLVAGRLEEARQRAVQAVELACQYQQRGWQAWALWLLGESLACQASPTVETALGHYRQALVLAEELGMRPLLAHCHRGLGTLQAKIGQAEQARAALATAIDLYRTMDMAFWLPQTEAVLAQVER